MLNASGNIVVLLAHLMASHLLSVQKDGTRGARVGDEQSCEMDQLYSSEEKGRESGDLIT